MLVESIRVANLIKSKKKCLLFFRITKVFGTVDPSILLANRLNNGNRGQIYKMIQLNINSQNKTSLLLRSKMRHQNYQK